jgi:hypothetical protein
MTTNLPPTLLWTLVTVSFFCGLAALALVLRLLKRDSARRFDALEARLAKLESPAGREALKTVATKARAKSAPNRRAARAAPSGRTLISVPDLAAPLASPPPDDLARRFGSIWDLAEAGASPESIARDTGQPIGQVELILGLKRPRASSGSRGPRMP